MNWIGGAYFVDTYYTRFRARGVVQGVPFDPARDTEWESPPAHGFGRPGCADWWTGGAGFTGLREKLLDQIDSRTGGLTAKLVAVLPASVTPAVVEDRAIRAVLTQDPPNLINTGLYDSRRDLAGRRLQ